MCEAWEPDPATGNLLKAASLDSFLLRRERRVRFDELVSYLERNHAYQRKYGPDPQQMRLFE